LKDKILEIGRDSSWYLGVNVITGIIGFIAIPIFTRIFVPREYGIYALVNTTISLGAPIVYVYLQSSMMRFYPEYKSRNELDVFYSTAFHYAPHFMILLLVVLLPLAAFVIPLGQYRLLVCLAISIFAFFAIYNVLLGMLVIRQMALQYAIIFVFVQFCNYIVGAGLAAWLKAGVAGPFWGWLGALVLAVPFQFAILHIFRRFEWKKNSRALQKEFFRFGFPLIFTTIAAEILTAADRYMVQGFKGAYQVGLYTVVYTLVMSVERLMVSFVATGALPVIYKVYEKDGEQQTIELIRKVTRLFLIIIVPVTLGLIMLRVPIIHVLTSPRYYGSTSIVTPLVLGIFLNNLAWLPFLAFRIKKKTNTTLIPIGAAAALNILINVLLIPKYGYVGAAWATLISYLVYFIVLTAMGHSNMRWSFPWLSALRISVAGAVMSVALFGLEKLPLHGALGLLALIVAGAVIYLAALFALGDITRGEKEFIARLMARAPVVGGLFSRKERK
jgi:O-antigen/teichoic acid export membrane protein